MRSIVLGIAVLLPIASLSAIAVATTRQDPTTAMIAKARAIAGDKPFGLFVRAKIMPAKAKEFEAAAAKAIAGTRKESGNISYELHHDLEEPGTYYFIEKWKNAAALEAHLKADYTVALLRIAGEASTEQPSMKWTTLTGEPK